MGYETGKSPAGLYRGGLGQVKQKQRDEAKRKKALRAAQLESLTLKQFRVGVITMGMHNFTIMAVDEKTAIDKVMKGEGGRDAGKEGPVPFAFRVQDMSILTPPVTLEQAMAEIMKGREPEGPKPEQASLLVKP